MLGKISEETPAFTVLHKAVSYEVRKYGPSVVAECSYGPGGWGNGNDGSPFGALAKYIGVFGKAQNEQKGASEAIAMTAPVLVTNGNKPTTELVTPPASQKIAMTAPVLVTPSNSRSKLPAWRWCRCPDGVGQPHLELRAALPAPCSPGAALPAPPGSTRRCPQCMRPPRMLRCTHPRSDSSTMAFVLPSSKYKTVAEAPTPTDPRVTLRQLPERVQAVRTFTWSFKPEAAKSQLQRSTYGPRQRQRRSS